MVIKELIELLEQLPPDMPIYAAHFVYDSTERLKMEDDTIVIVDTHEGQIAVIDPLDLMNTYQTIGMFLKNDS